MIKIPKRKQYKRKTGKQKLKSFRQRGFFIKSAKKEIAWHNGGGFKNYRYYFDVYKGGNLVRQSVLPANDISEAKKLLTPELEELSKYYL